MSCEFYRFKKIICQTGELAASVPCPDPIYDWSTGETVETVDLISGIVRTVDVDCDDCDASDSASYCFPLVYSYCIFGDDQQSCPPGPDPVVVVLTNLSFTYSCAGDSIDWSTIDFYNVPAGFTLDYGGANYTVEITIDDTVKAGIYYFVARVYTFGGIPSNYFLIRLTVDGSGCCPEP